MPFGGNQIKKSKEGLQSFMDGGVKIGKKFIAIERSDVNFAKAFIFGKYSLPEVQAYFDRKQK